MPLDGTFLKERITKTKAIIVAYEDAITAISTGGIETYTLDTGQSRQTVTKQNLKDMNESLDGLYNRLSTLCLRQGNQNGTGGATNLGRAGW